MSLGAAGYPAWGGSDTETPQVSLSSLEHHAYCPRQCGLILLEDAFTDDASTVRGTLQHQRVDTPGIETRPRVRTLRSLPVWDDRLGLTGICDVVEIHPDGRPVPVEHKSGKYLPGGPADVQLAGQALCLESMFSTGVPEGFIWSGADRRRHAVAIDTALRKRVADTIDAVRALTVRARLPAAPADSRCRKCSMHDGCMPRVLDGKRRYHNALADLYRIDEEDDQ